MNVYKTTDCDWFFAKSAEHARELTLELYNGDDEYLVFPLEDIRALDGAELDRLIFTDEDGNKRTFRQELQLLIASGANPGMFASTEI